MLVSAGLVHAARTDRMHPSACSSSRPNVHPPIHPSIHWPVSITIATATIHRDIINFNWITIDFGPVINTVADTRVGIHDCLGEHVATWRRRMLHFD